MSKNDEKINIKDGYLPIHGEFMTGPIKLRGPAEPLRLQVPKDAIIRDCFGQAIAIFGATAEELALLKDILIREKAQGEKENPVLDSLIEKVEILEVRI